MVPSRRVEAVHPQRPPLEPGLQLGQRLWLERLVDLDCAEQFAVVEVTQQLVHDLGNRRLRPSQIQSADWVKRITPRRSDKHYQQATRRRTQAGQTGQIIRVQDFD